MGGSEAVAHPGPKGHAYQLVREHEGEGKRVRIHHVHHEVIVETLAGRPSLWFSLPPGLRAPTCEAALLELHPKAQTTDRTPEDLLQCLKYRELWREIASSSALLEECHSVSFGMKSVLGVCGELVCVPDRRLPALV